MEAARHLNERWRRTGNVHARGRAFETDGTERDPAEAFAGSDSLQSVLDTAERLDGFYAAVVRTEETVFLVCDHARSVPLYFRTAGPLRVSDVATRLAARDPSNYDPVAASEFALTRYVTRGETLRPDVASVRAGEVVAVPRDAPAEFERHRYFRYRPTATESTGRSDSALRARLGTVLGDVFDRVARIAGDRQVWVPLSGGWDSRLVATMLVERGVEVVGFTFGARGHADVEVSRDVADALGIEWEWVEYTTGRWYDWYHSEDRAKYHEYAFDFDSLPFLAEWPAVYELQRQGRIPDDAVVCPGHTVATPSERIPEEWLSTSPIGDDVVEYILDEHYSLWEWEDADLMEAFANRIAADAQVATVETGPQAAAAYEQWEWTTRMSTFTNADLRLYEWFGLDWWLPLWDRRYVSFWASCPLSARHRKRLQTEFTGERFAEVASVDDSTVGTDRDWTPFDQLLRTFETAPVTTCTGSFDDWLGVQSAPKSAWETRGNYPLKWYGVVPEEAADRFEPAKNLYSLRTLEALGSLSFDPPRIDGSSLDSTLRLPPTPDSDGGV